MKLATTFESFCTDGSRWLADDSVPKAKKDRFAMAFDDYLTLKRASREEGHVLKLNRVGIEKNEKNLNE